ncbi:phospholipase/carboxylesterase [Loktanella fryxellensis]|uniref:Phospholipase/carboxylesterase n=1 Tax=Loktanella fryxellensis TaxID=245187 RepID=A0A1H8CUY0_9RHOB|nr:alpha/beta hydrolase [Loktanella fryxellensis]SEM98796.1 phospholipase/carboxylesterase [Loktanella fryxellensis]
MYRFAETQGEAGAPLVFTFHGTGGSAVQFHGLAGELIPGAHVISPQGDVSEHGAARFFRRTGEGVYDMDDLALRRAAMRDFVVQAVARLEPSRVVGLGYSNGANILAAVMLDGPRLFDSAVLLHPLIPWQPDTNPALAGVDVLITAGRRDPICPAPQTQGLADALSGMGATVDLHWHPGGHEIAQSELTAIQAALSR